MITSELITYVKTRREQGIPDTQIYQELRSNGWSRKDLQHIFHHQTSFSSRIQPIIHHRIWNKWSISILILLVISVITAVYIFIIVPYTRLHNSINTMRKISSFQYSGTTSVLLSSHPVQSIIVSFQGAANLHSAPTQTHTSITARSQGFHPNFQGNGELTRINQTIYANIHHLKQVPVADPTNTLNHWYIVSSSSAQLISFQQLLPSLASKHLITITRSSTEKTLQRIDFQVSHNHLTQLKSTENLDHITGSLWIDPQNYVRHIVFSTYLPNTAQPNIHADITLSDFNKKVPIKQPSSITDSNSGTSIYYLLKIIQSVLNS